MKKLLMLMVVLTMCLALPAMAATTILSDDFDAHSDGAITGQYAPTGQQWLFWVGYTSLDVGSAYGRTGKGIGVASDWSDRLNKISLGTTLTGSVGDEVVVLSFDAERGYTGAWGAATNTRQDVRLTDTVSGNFIKVSWGDADATYGWLHKIEVIGLGLDTQLDAYRSGWVNFELSVNLTTGQTKLVWYDLDTPANGATYDLGVFDTSTYAFAPDEVGVHQRKVAVPTIGMDNLNVETIAGPSGTLVITESDGSTDSTEAFDFSSPDDSFTVALGSAPTADVNVIVTGSRQDDPPLGAGWPSYSPTVLEFTTTNWATPQTVEIQARQDELLEGPHTNLITLNPESTDPNYGLIPNEEVTINVTDAEIEIGILGTYIDAEELANTVSNDGSAWIGGSDDDADDMWHKYINNSTYPMEDDDWFASADSEDSPMLKTTFNTGAASTDYEVRVVFAGHSWVSLPWGVDAGLSAGSLAEYRRYDGVSTKTSAVMYDQEDGSYYWIDQMQSLLGIGTSDGSGDISVYVDDSTDTGRVAWYDGVSYQIPKVILSKTLVEVSEGDATGDTFTITLDQSPLADVVVSIREYRAPGDVDDISSVTLNSGNYSTGETVTVIATDDVYTWEPAVDYTFLVIDANSPGDPYFDGHRTTVVVAVSENDCGSGVGYPDMDFNNDCYVDVNDLADFVAEWLDCTMPNDPACN